MKSSQFLTSNKKLYLNYTLLELSNWLGFIVFPIGNMSLYYCTFFTSCIDFYRQPLRGVCDESFFPPATFMSPAGSRVQKSHFLQCSRNGFVPDQNTHTHTRHKHKVYTSLCKSNITGAFLTCLYSIPVNQRWTILHNSVRKLLSSKLFHDAG